ncbi:MAG TPA: M24 family metallopeptidase [Aggregatilineales bacterium]|nr:M24 family metallopeptidase [Aggregatilineales bacterium]
MRSDLDGLMAERNLDAFIIPGTEGHSPQRDYMTGGVHASAMVVKKRGEAPILIVNHMEIDEAKKSGLTVMTLDDFHYSEIVTKHGRVSAATRKALWEQYIEKLGIQGRLTLYGSTDIQYVLNIIDLLKTHFAGRLEIVLDETPDIFAIASETKDEQELEKLRESGRRTSLVMRQVRDWISGHRADNGQVVDAEGKPLTIGTVKRYLRLCLLEQDMEDGGVTIFAQGHDAGVPHSRGEADDILRPGEAIIFDLFPYPIGGGYYHDTTRTWCPGFAREDVQKAYDLVKDVYFRSLEGVELGRPTKEIATKVCEWFEAAGHPTRKSTPNTTEGYTHSLGHGIGLAIHEEPGVSPASADSMVFKAGNVVTIEPGLYYPSKGYGVRIEDSLYLDEAGQLHNLTDIPYDLIVPLNG